MNCLNLLDKTVGKIFSIPLFNSISLYLDYYPNKQLCEKSYWKDGERVGKCTRYYYDGKLVDKYYWKDGKKITEEEYKILKEGKMSDDRLKKVFTKEDLEQYKQYQSIDSVEEMKKIITEETQELLKELNISMLEWLKKEKIYNVSL